MSYIVKTENVAKMEARYTGQIAALEQRVATISAELEQKNEMIALQKTVIRDLNEYNERSQRTIDSQQTTIGKLLDLQKEKCECDENYEENYCECTEQCPTCKWCGFYICLCECE